VAVLATKKRSFPPRRVSLDLPLQRPGFMSGKASPVTSPLASNSSPPSDLTGADTSTRMSAQREQFVHAVQANGARPGVREYPFRLMCEPALFAACRAWMRSRGREVRDVP